MVRRSHVETWVKSMAARNLAPGTIHTRTNNVRAVLRGAVADRVIPTDPSEGITLPRRRRAAVAMSIPRVAEVGKILSVSDGPFRAFVCLATSAAAAGVEERVIAGTTGHKGTAMLRRYIRDGSIFRENAAAFTWASKHCAPLGASEGPLRERLRTVEQALQEMYMTPLTVPVTVTVT